MNLRRYLKLKRKRGFSVQRFADEVGVCRQRIYDYMEGETPRPEVALRIEELTGGKVTKESLLFPPKGVSPRKKFQRREDSRKRQGHKKNIRTATDKILERYGQLKDGNEDNVQ